LEVSHLFLYATTPLKREDTAKLGINNKRLLAFCSNSYLEKVLAGLAS
jgi:hypothetical protein